MFKMTRKAIIKRLILYSAMISCVLNFADTLQNGASYEFAFGAALFTLVPYAILIYWATPSYESAYEYIVILSSSILICIFGLMAYGVYFFGGPSTQVNSAGHLHVVFFPGLHIALTLIVLFLAFVIERLGIYICGTNIKHNNHYHSTQKDARVK